MFIYNNAGLRFNHLYFVINDCDSQSHKKSTQRSSLN